MSVKHAVYRQLSRLSALAGRQERAGKRILLYHAIGTALPDDRYAISVAREDFVSHLDILAGGRKRPRPAVFGPAAAGVSEVSVTFDDGYRDCLSIAAPLLAERNIPFTVFVTVRHLQDRAGLYLDAAGLRELSGVPGASIGFHGLEHRPMDRLPDPELRRELEHGRKALEDALGGPVRTLSYPHGAVDRRVRDAALRAGFEAGGCSRYGLNTPSRDPLLLCRTEITGLDTLSDFQLKLEGAWDWFRFRHPDPQR